MPGLPVGSEYEWAAWLTGSKAAGPGMATSLMRYMVYSDPAWPEESFDLDREFGAVRRQPGPAIDAVDPDLRPFFARGGKLLIYHGWDDAAIPAGNSLRYHAAVRRAVGRSADTHMRLFMLPGVAHCSGGHGPDTIDYLGALDRWAGDRCRARALDRDEIRQSDSGHGGPAGQHRAKPASLRLAEAGQI